MLTNICSDLTVIAVVNKNYCNFRIVYLLTAVLIAIKQEINCFISTEMEIYKIYLFGNNQIYKLIFIYIHIIQNLNKLNFCGLQ